MVNAPAPSIMINRDKIFRVAVRFVMHNLIAIIAIIGALIFSAGWAWADKNELRNALKRGDYSIFLEKLHKLSEGGDARAQTALGQIYFKPKSDIDFSEFINQNYIEAAIWFQKAANQGYAMAQLNLGTIYYRGTGVVASNVKAYMWWSLAESQGNKKAATNLQMIRKFMTANQITKALNATTAWQQNVQRKKQHIIDREERKIIINARLQKIIKQAFNWTPHPVREGTLTKPGPPISETCPSLIAKRIQEVSNEKFLKLMDQIGGDIAIIISSRLYKQLSLHELERVIEVLENFSGWSDEKQKLFQESELGIQIQKTVKPALTESLSLVAPKYKKLAPKVFIEIEGILNAEGIHKVSKHNWCLN